MVQNLTKHSVKISVLMPVYNTKGEYLREAIESILNQTYSDFEFLILNDGSTNKDTLCVLESFVKKDSRIRIIEGEHKGIGYALNTLIQEAKGEYLARMDSDDISDSTRFEKQINYFNSHPDISILSSSLETFPNKVLLIRQENIKFLDIYKGCFIAHPAVMMRKSDLDRYNLRYNENLKVSEDYDLWSRAIRYLKFANIKEPLLKYRVLENSNYHKNLEMVENVDKKIKQSMLDFLTENKELQDKIKELIFPTPERKYSFLENIFSIKNSFDKKHKILTIFWIKLKFKRK